MDRKIFERVTLEDLINYIEGKSDEQTRPVISKWISIDKENLKLFRVLEEIWNNRSDLAGINREIVEEDFKTVLAKINEKNQQTNISAFSGKPFIRTILRLTAAVAIIVAIGAAYVAGRAGVSNANNAKTGFNEFIVPNGQRSKVILSDGTSIWLNAGTRLRFPSEFHGNTRDVWLDGEGLFNVTKDTSRLFYVHTEDIDVKVHGTIFNLKAYSGEGLVETTVVEGLVSFESKENKEINKENIFLEPNHKAVYVKDANVLVTEEVKREVSSPIEPQRINITKPIKVEPVISWAEGRLIFNDENLGNIADKLEKKYDVVIQIDNEKLNNLRYTGILKEVSIEQALRALQLTTGIQYTINENFIRIFEQQKRN